MRLGLCCINNKLRDEHIFTSRTTRLETILQKNKESKGSGIRYVKELFSKNLDDLLTMLVWNENHGIRVLRMSSEMAPHITNPRLMKKADKTKPLKLVWSMKPFAKKMKEIGAFVKQHGHRLTFHPGQYVVIGSPNPQVVINSIRDLYWHSLVMDMMGLPLDCVINIHGGGIYGDKESAIDRWVKTFNKMPIAAKRRIVIENDEESYSIEDVLDISRRVEFQKGMVRNSDKNGQPSVYKIPVTFDVFHYYCYNKTLLRRYNIDLAAHKKSAADHDLAEMEIQRTLDELLPDVVSTWGKRRPKMHISEQLKGGSLGAHSDYVRNIPIEMLRIAKKHGIDIMIEAKKKEAAVLYLMKKYKRWMKKS